MFEPISIYQTIDTRHNELITEQKGPVFCKDLRSKDWLGKGYYFWDSHIELAQQWGLHHYNKRGYEYYICHSTCHIDVKCFDLHASGNKRIEFEEYANECARKLGKSINDLLVRDLVVFIRSKQEFINAYDSIRILGESSFRQLLEDEFVLYFDYNNQNAKYSKYPAVQICLFTIKSQSLKGYEVVEKSNYLIPGSNSGWA